VLPLGYIRITFPLIPKWLSRCLTALKTWLLAELAIGFKIKEQTLQAASLIRQGFECGSINCQDLTGIGF